MFKGQVEETRGEGRGKWLKRYLDREETQEIRILGKGICQMLKKEGFQTGQIFQTDQ